MNPMACLDGKSLLNGAFNPVAFKPAALVQYDLRDWINTDIKPCSCLPVKSYQRAAVGKSGCKIAVSGILSMYLRQVTGNITRISLAWSCAYILREENKNGEENKSSEKLKTNKVTLIDCGLQKDRPELLEALGVLGIGPADIDVLLLTHAHCDHAGNAAYFAAHGAAVITHEAEARYMQFPRRSYAYRGMDALLRPFTSLAFTIGEMLYPVERCVVARTVADGDIIEAPGGPLRVIHCPGHTPGQIAFYRESDGVLFSGDVVLNIIPVKCVTGLSLAMRLLSDNWAQAGQSARKLAKLRPRMLLAGHGQPLTDDTANRLQVWAETL